MKKILMMAGMGLLAGCATKEMESTPFYTGERASYTGPVEERVNVWPVVYWREPVGSVAWPVVSFSDTHFALRPVYSQYRQNGKEGAFDEFNLVWPLCQFDFKGRDYRVFPFFWGYDADGQPYQTVFPVYWNGANYNSLFPVYTYKSKGEERSLSALFGLAGMSKDAERESNWCFPLWYWNDKGSLVTILGGREVEDGGETVSWMVTPFIGVTSGKKSGGWIFPLWHHYKQRDFEESAAIADCDRLPEEIKLWQETVTNMTWNAEQTERNVPEESTRTRGDRIWSKNWTTWLLLCDWEDTVSSNVLDDYVLNRWIERGNPLVFEYEWNRRAHFDFESREKTADRETSEASLLVWLYRHKRETNSITGELESRHNVLWKLWDRVEKDGNVSLDVFPGFTYDSKTDGYRKTSFLWRLFRYESDPKTDATAVDFLFIPVWR